MPFILYAGWHLKIALIDNPRYANEVFDPILGQFDVLESRRWHPIGSLAFDCSYAVVALSDAAPQSPPAAPGPTHWQLRWGSDDWLPTPGPALSDTTRDAAAACEVYWQRNTVARIQNALTRPGSFASIGSVGETVFVYSKPQRIAARIRYGD